MVSERTYKGSDVDLEHGTRTCYTYYGCRCVACRRANCDYQNERNRRIREGTWEFPRINLED